MEQVRAMWLNGQIAATDQLSEQGRSQWYSASTMMAVAKAEESVPKKKAGCLSLLGTALAALLIIVVIFGILGASVKDSGGSGSGATGSIQGSSSIKRWVRNNIADPEARVVALSEVMTIGGEDWKKARIAGRNRFGGPIMEDKIFSLHGSTVIGHWTTTQFSLWVESEAAKLTEDRAAKLRREASAFATATLYAQ